MRAAGGFAIVFLLSGLAVRSVAGAEIGQRMSFATSNVQHVEGNFKGPMNGRFLQSKIKEP
ncbi:unnamed protein product [Ascophyllum nodosum]